MRKLKKKNIFIISGEQSVATNLKSAFLGAQYSITSFPDSIAQSLLIIKEKQPDIIIIDVQEKNASENIIASKNLRTVTDAPILFLLDKKDKKAESLFNDFQSYDMVFKPCDGSTLRTAAEFALYKHAMLRESIEQRHWLTTALHSISDAVIITDKNGNVKLLNTAAESLTGWKGNEALEKKLSEILVIRFEGTYKSQFNPIAQVVKDKKPLSLLNHLTLLNKNNQRFDVELSASPMLDTDNDILGIVITLRDVTEKRRYQESLNKSEKRFRALIEKSSEAVSIIDETGVVLYTSPYTALMLGRDPQYYIGKNAFDFIHPDDIEKNKRLLQDLSRNPGTSTHATLRFLNKNNVWRWLEATVTNLKLDPAVNGIVVNFRDISYRKEAEEQLNHINTRLNLISRVTGEVIGSQPIHKQVNEMADRVRRAFNVDAVVVRMVEDGQLSLLANVGAPPESLPQLIPLHEGISEKILTTRRAVTYKNVKEKFSEHYKALEIEKTRRFNFVSYAGAPLIMGHAIIGIIGLYTTKEEREFTSTDLEHLQVVGNHIAVSLTNNGLFREVREQNVEMKQRIEEQIRIEKLLRHSEDRYKAFVEQSSEGIYRTAFTEPISTLLPMDTQIQLMYERGYIAECNVVMAKMYGFNSVEETIGTKIKDLLVPNDPYNFEYMKEFIRSGYKFFDKESHEQDKNGVTKYFLNNGIGIIENDAWHGVWGSQREITERKIAETALRESEERYRTLVEHSPNAIAVHVNGVVKFVNKAAVQLLGANSINELIGTNVMLYVHPDFREIAKERIAKVYDSEAVPSLEQKWVRIDGSVIDVEVTSIPFVFEGISAAQVIVRDVTERRRAEHAIRESELRFRSLFENAKDAVFIADTKTGVIIDANAEAEKLLKRTRTEIIGKHHTQIHPQERIDEALSLFREQMITLGEQPVEFEVIDSHGKRIPVEIKSSLIRIDEHRIVSQGIYRDITERKSAEEALKRSEEKYRALFEQSKDGIYISTYFGKFIDVNPAMVELLGYSSKEEVFALDIKKAVYYHPKDRERFKLSIADRSFVKDLELSLRHRDGSEINVLLTSTVERASDGTPLFYSGTVRDVTERKRLEEQLIQAQKMESIGTLAGGIAHDFNNLLAMILGTSELIKNKTTDNQVIQTYINRIIEASDRGASISKQLLLFSRPEQAELQPLSVALLLEQLHEFLAHFLSKEIVIKCEINDKSAVIMGDSGHLHQAIVNLSLNASDAMPVGGALTLATSIVDGSVVHKRFPNADDHNYVSISVSDTGSGIDPQIIQRIFEPFYTTKARGKGTGLGLSIVHGIVKLHHGYTDVESSKGIGTSFTMYFPSLKIEVPEEHNQREVMLERNTETILVVDDEEMLREILAESLKDEGYNVLLASDGIEALELYRKRKNDISIIITDLGMPNMNGSQLYEKLVEVNPDVKVIVSSGFLSTANKSELLRIGIKDVLTKPYKFDVIFSTVRKVLSNE